MSDAPDIRKVLEDLNDSAIATLKTVLESEDSSEDVRRKAAVDILNFSQVGKSKSRAPQVTEEQLEHLGRVLVEAEEVRKSLTLSEGPMVGSA